MGNQENKEAGNQGIKKSKNSEISETGKQGIRESRNQEIQKSRDLGDIVSGGGYVGKSFAVIFIKADILYYVWKEFV